jgi:hypothetical protein
MITVYRDKISIASVIAKRMQVLAIITMINDVRLVLLFIDIDNGPYLSIKIDVSLTIISTVSKSWLADN